MKKLSILLLVMGVSQIGATVLEDQFEDAVVAHNPLKVGQLLRRLNQASTDTKKTQEFTANLSQLAQEILEKKKSRVSLVRNGKDFSMALVGSVVGVFGLLYFGHSCYDAYYAYKPTSHWDKYNSIRNILFWNDDSLAYDGSMSLAPGLFGAYIAYKGLTCATQKESIEAARAVQDSVDEHNQEHA